jgi:hypothetical protein
MMYSRAASKKHVEGLFIPRGPEGGPVQPLKNSQGCVRRLQEDKVHMTSREGRMGRIPSRGQQHCSVCFYGAGGEEMAAKDKMVN